jgi:2,3-dihydroxybiphenyl 1,2-dioxygenase
MLTSLGYLGIASGRLDDWEAFATGLLGMQTGRRSATELSLRIDSREQRLFISNADHETIACIGWEVGTKADLDRLGARITAANVDVSVGSRALADQRGVSDLIIAHDPLGNRLEFFCGAEPAAAAFKSGRPIKGFRTGSLGLGHAVLTARCVDDVIPFYRDVLGFRLSDYALRPFKAFFFHLGTRHHSFAVVETGVDGFHHLMVEMNALDDVGQAYDLAQLEEGRVAVTLGRHTNDFMTSFYARSPSNFLIEYGWGGRSIEPRTWTPFECDYGPSFWGHERSWLSSEKREEARRLRLKAAEDGFRAPDFVRDPNED